MGSTTLGGDALPRACMLRREFREVEHREHVAYRRPRRFVRNSDDSRYAWQWEHRIGGEELIRPISKAQSAIYINSYGCR